MNHLYLPGHDAVIAWHRLPGADPVVCLPGICIDAAANFLDLVTQPRLAGRGFVLIDHIGSGLSDHAPAFDHSLASHAATVAAVMDHLGLRAAPVFGHSMGGSVAIALAAARPDLVSRLIVGEGNLTPGGGSVTASIAAQSLEAFLTEGHAARLAGLRRALRDGRRGAEVLALSAARADPRALWAISRSLVHLPEGFADRFLGLDLPRTFLYGEKTHPATLGHPTPDAPDPAWLEAHGVATVTLPAAGHLLMLDNPAGAADILHATLSAGP